MCSRSTWSPQPRHFLQSVWKKWLFVCLACPLCLEASDCSLTLQESLCRHLEWYLFLFLCPKRLRPPSHLMWDRRYSGVQPEAGPQIRNYGKYALWENEVHWADTPGSRALKQLRKRRTDVIILSSEIWVDTAGHIYGWQESLTQRSTDSAAATGCLILLPSQFCHVYHDVTAGSSGYL